MQADKELCIVFNSVDHADAYCCQHLLVATSLEPLHNQSTGFHAWDNRSSFCAEFGALIVWWISANRQISMFGKLERQTWLGIAFWPNGDSRDNGFTFTLLLFVLNFRSRTRYLLEYAQLPARISRHVSSAGYSKLYNLNLLVSFDVISQDYLSLNSWVTLLCGL